MRRIVASLGTALVVLVATAAPASAHSVGGATSSNLRTSITALNPALDGVTVRVIEGGARLELTNRSAGEVLVLGYSDEPYLRIGMEGVFENRQAPTWFLNRTRDGQAPAGGDASAAPAWRQTGDGPTARWFDHRTHWTGAELPHAVLEAPDRTHVIEPAWRVPIIRGDVRAELTGRLVWEPGPSSLPWLLGALVLGLGVALVHRIERWAPVFATAVAVLLAVDLLHTFGLAFAVGGGLGTRLVTVITGGFYAVVGWVLAVVAFRLLVRGSVDGLYAAVFAGLSIAVFGGLLDLGTLSSSVLPMALPAWLGRACVAVSLGLGCGLAAAAALVIRRTPVDPASSAEDPASAPETA